MAPGLSSAAGVRTVTAGPATTAIADAAAAAAVSAGLGATQATRLRSGGAATA